MSLKYTGKGVRVAIVDTGIVMHPDFGNRIVFFKDFVNRKKTLYDDNGHGTHVGGTMTIIFKPQKEYTYHFDDSLKQESVLEPLQFLFE